jgi:hypothetical protein
MLNPDSNERIVVLSEAKDLFSFAPPLLSTVRTNANLKTSSQGRRQQVLRCAQDDKLNSQQTYLLAR